MVVGGSPNECKPRLMEVIELHEDAKMFYGLVNLWLIDLENTKPSVKSKLRENKIKQNIGVVDVSPATQGTPH